MIRNPLLEKIKKERLKYIDIYIDNSFDLSNRIQYLMEENDIDQKTLAKILKKNESEISKWMSGSHNFTLKTLAKIEDALGSKILQVCNEQTSFQTEVIISYKDFYRECKSKSFLDDTITKYSTSKNNQIEVLLN